MEKFGIKIKMTIMLGILLGSISYAQTQQKKETVKKQLFGGGLYLAVVPRRPIGS